MIIAVKGYKAKSEKWKGTQDKAWRKPRASFQESSLAEIHRMHLPTPEWVVWQCIWNIYQRSSLETQHPGFFTAAAAAAKSLQSCPTLCDPRDGSPPGSAIPGILHARTLEWVAISFSNAGKWKWSRSVVSDSSNPMDCSLPGSSTHGILQARVLEWGAIAFSRFFTGGLFLQRYLLLSRCQNYSSQKVSSCPI